MPVCVLLDHITEYRYSRDFVHIYIVYVVSKSCNGTFSNELPKSVKGKFNQMCFIDKAFYRKFRFGLSIYFLYYITYANIQNMILQKLYNGIQKKVK